MENAAADVANDKLINRFSVSLFSFLSLSFSLFPFFFLLFLYLISRAQERKKERTLICFIHDTNQLVKAIHDEANSTVYV